MCSSLLRTCSAFFAAMGLVATMIAFLSFCPSALAAEPLSGLVCDSSVCNGSGNPRCVTGTCLLLGGDPFYCVCCRCYNGACADSGECY